MRDQLAGANKDEIQNIFSEAAQNWKIMPDDEKAVSSNITIDSTCYTFTYINVYYYYTCEYTGRNHYNGYISHHSLQHIVYTPLHFYET